MNFIHAILLGAAGLLGGQEPAVQFTRAGWYRAHLQSDQKITLKVIEDRGNSFVCLYQGASLLVAKDRLKSLKRIGESAVEKQKGSSLPAAKEEKIRDAIEDLGSTDDQVVQGAYDRLASEIEAGREILHESLKHRSVRVRKLLVKLLGERGESSRDGDRVANLLGDSDEKVRLAAVMAVRRLGSEAMDSILLYLRREQVANSRKMAVENLRLWKDVRAVAPLIEMMGIEKDRGVRVFIARALKTLTGKDLGDDHAAWLAYLKEFNDRERFKGLEPVIEKKSGDS